MDLRHAPSDEGAARLLGGRQVHELLLHARARLVADLELAVVEASDRGCGVMEPLPPEQTSWAVLGSERAGHRQWGALVEVRSPVVHTPSAPSRPVLVKSVPPGILSATDTADEVCTHLLDVGSWLGPPVHDRITT